jgi:hypothetical protein
LCLINSELKEDEGHKLTVAEDQAKEYSVAKLKYLDNDPLPFQVIESRLSVCDKVEQSMSESRSTSPKHFEKSI